MAYFQALTANKRSADAEKLGCEVIERNKTFGPMYDLLYLQYMQQNQAADAEQILKLKVASNPQQANYLVAAGAALSAHASGAPIWMR